MWNRAAATWQRLTGSWFIPALITVSQIVLGVFVGIFVYVVHHIAGPSRVFRWKRTAGNAGAVPSARGGLAAMYDPPVPTHSSVAPQAPPFPHA